VFDFKNHSLKKQNIGADILNIDEKRQYVKLGMVGSLGGLFATGFLRFKYARMLHPLLGWVFLGFAVWHHIVSKPESR
jgi:hypothetical protein